MTGRQHGRTPTTTGKLKRDAQSAKISQLVREGYPQKQAVAISFSELRQGGVRRLRQSHAKGRIKTRKGRA